MAHWLAARLRLQQELAADATAAALAGGRASYLAALARLALRRDEIPAAWPARPFLPARGTFVRRIEMLRDAKIPLESPPPSRLGRPLAVGALLAVGLVTAGLRGPEGPGVARAQETVKKAATARPAVDDAADYVPVDAAMVVTLHPAKVFSRPEFARLKAMFDDMARNPQRGSINLPPDQVEQLILAVPRRAVQGGPGPFGLGAGTLLIFRTTKPQDWDPVVGQLVGQPTELDVRGRKYVRTRLSPIGTGYATPDDRTLLIGDEEALKVALNDIGRARPPRAWDAALAQVGADDPAITVAVETAWLAERFGQGGPPAVADAFGPLFTKAYAYAMAIGLGDDGLTVRGTASCSTADGAGRVADTLKAAVTLGRNALDRARLQVREAPPDAAAGMALALEAIDELSRSPSIDAAGKVVTLEAKADVDLAEVAAAVAPAIGASRAASDRMRSINNMKQIGLAMHNYASTYGRFPPAVLYGPDGRTPHSWRVALLPYLEQDALFRQYNFNEPWDGPNNIKLVEQMPPVFAATGGLEPGRTSYFVPVGPNTIFPSGRAQGAGFAEITDGLSNTILAVEAVRPVAWTKPEDIDFDPKADPPEIGGYSADGFNVLFGDGAVRYLKNSIDRHTLKALFTANGGEVISLP